MVDADTILGAVIAGGASSRFGSDKAVALLHGKPLIEHAIAAIAPYCGRVVVCGRRWRDLVSLEDEPVAGLGPLGGINAALAHAAAAGFARVLSIGCDMPVLPAGLIQALIAHPAAYCSDAPILGCWPADAQPALSARLAGSDPGGGKSRALSIRGWAEAIGAVPIPAPAPLANINTPGDLARR